jgi:hypothetical protein
MRTILLTPVVVAVIATMACGDGQPDPTELRRLDAEELDVLVTYLDENGRPPVEYVLEKLRRNDVVLLGEMHRIRHDVLLVDELIPRLAEAGVYDLGSEFYCAEDQEAIDRLLNAPEFSEATARELLRHGTGGTWPFREYMELLRTAWRHNRERNPESPPLRIIGLIPRIDYEKLNEGIDVERENERGKSDDYDRTMADALEREVLSKGRKALVHCGINHAFTRYKKRRLENGVFVDSKRTRCGSYLYDRHPGSVFLIYLHAPWYTYSGEAVSWYLPFNGAIDQAFIGHGSPAGFDVTGGPFARLTHPGAYYAEGYEDFRADTIFDGYVIMKTIDRYEGVTTADDWIESEDVFQQLKRQLPNRRWAATLKTPEEYLEGVTRDAELERVYADCIAAWLEFKGR